MPVAKGVHMFKPNGRHLLRPIHWSQSQACHRQAYRRMDHDATVLVISTLPTSNPASMADLIALARSVFLKTSGRQLISPFWRHSSSHD